MTATRPSAKGIDRNTAQSRAETPNRTLCNALASPSADTVPAAIPANERRTPLASTIVKTVRSEAPNATRMPISRERSRTPYAITPNTPIAASTTAVSPNATITVVVNSLPIEEVRDTSSIERTFDTAAIPLESCKARCTDAASVSS